MPSNGSFHQLILRWFLLRQQGLTISPADLCKDCPEHQEVVGVDRDKHLALIEFPVEADSRAHRIWVPLSSLVDWNGAAAWPERKGRPTRALAQR
jgi:hypothetical protein